MTVGDHVIIGEPIGFVRDNYALELALYRLNPSDGSKTPLSVAMEASAAALRSRTHVIAKRQQDTVRLGAWRRSVNN